LRRWLTEQPYRIANDLKYSPKELKTNVNVTQTSSLKEFFILIAGVLVFLVIGYGALGFLVDFIAPRLPYKIEQALSGPFEHNIFDVKKNKESEELERILGELVDVMPEEVGSYRATLVDDNRVNAMALPGGNIIVFTGLMNEVESEEELAFVLGHELGHFANRDHLKGLGRGLVFYSLFVLLLGPDSSLTELIGGSLAGVQVKFSQHQEVMADMYALDLLNRRYGQVTGAMGFMEKLASKEKKGRLAYYFSTHPHPKARIANIKSKIWN
jgi:Zn-dependent protease with chaperone function